jgi:methyl coenzyme M reductase subunit D
VTCVGVALPGGKNVQVTVPLELVPVVRQWTENYKKLWQMIEDVSSINRELLRGRLLDPPPPPGVAAGKRAKHSSRKGA